MVTERERAYGGCVAYAAEVVGVGVGDIEDALRHPAWKRVHETGQGDSRIDAVAAHAHASSVEEG